MDSAETPDRRLPLPYPLVWLGACTLLACRWPELLGQAAFLAEDGTVFFKDAYESSWWEPLFAPHNGYMHGWPRLFAALLTPLPLEWLPRAYNLVACLFAGGCLAWFARPEFRRLLPDDRLRLATVGLLCLLPHQDSVGKFAYIQASVLPWLVWVTFVPLPRRGSARWGLAAFAVLSVWTAPLALAVVPRMAWLAWCGQRPGQPDREGRREGRWWAWICALSASSVLVLLANAGAERDGLPPAWEVLDRVVPTLGQTWADAVIGPALLGQTVTDLIGPRSRGLLAAFGLLGTVAWLWLGLRRRGRTRAVMLWSLGISVTSVALLGLRLVELIRFEEAYSPFAPGRYFSLAVEMLTVSLVLVLAQGPDGGWRSRAPWMGMAFLALLHLPGLPIRFPPGMRGEFDWPQGVAAIRAAEDAARDSGEPQTVRIPTHPKGWEIRLKVLPPR